MEDKDAELTKKDLEEIKKSVLSTYSIQDLFDSIYGKFGKDSITKTQNRIIDIDVVKR